MTLVETPPSSFPTKISKRNGSVNGPSVRCWPSDITPFEPEVNKMEYAGKEPEDLPWSQGHGKKCGEWGKSTDSIAKNQQTGDCVISDRDGVRMSFSRVIHVVELFVFKGPSLDDSRRARSIKYTSVFDILIPSVSIRSTSKFDTFLIPIFSNRK